MDHNFRLTNTEFETYQKRKQNLKINIGLFWWLISKEIKKYRTEQGRRIHSSNRLLAAAKIIMVKVAKFLFVFSWFTNIITTFFFSKAIFLAQQATCKTTYKVYSKKQSLLHFFSVCSLELLGRKKWYFSLWNYYWQKLKTYFCNLYFAWVSKNSQCFKKHCEFLIFITLKKFKAEKFEMEHADLTSLFI